jgi:hypothetical protein
MSGVGEFPARYCDLNKWHHAVHQDSGDMAIRFNRATVDDLKRWAGMLRVIADEMDSEGGNQ